MLEADGCDRAEVAADLAALFKQRDLAAAHGSDARSLQTAGAGADDDDIFRLGQLRDLIVALHASLNVDCAGQLGLTAHDASDAFLVAQQAGTDVITTVIFELVREIGVGDELAS